MARPNAFLWISNTKDYSKIKSYAWMIAKKWMHPTVIKKEENNSSLSSGKDLAVSHMVQAGVCPQRHIHASNILGGWLES